MSAPDIPRPFTLWFETLPSDDTARLLIWPRSSDIHVVFYWNGQFHSDRSFSTLADAESWGQRFLRILQNDAIAGALVGYDADVLTRLQAECTAQE